MRKEKLILIGGGGHCKSCIDVIEQEGRFEIAGIIDTTEKIGQLVLNYSIIGSDEELPELVKQYKHFFITLGQIKSPELRISIYNKLLKYKIQIPVIISPTSYVSKHSYIGNGTIIMHQALINANANIGVNCIINSKALIEHDTIIGNHCHISTGSIVNGGVKIGEGTFFGSSAVSKQYIEIKENSIIQANSFVK